MPVFVAWLVPFVTAMLGSFAARVLIGAGLAVVSYAFLKTTVDALMSLIHDNMTGLPVALIAIVKISGVGDGLSLVGSAMLVRAALVSASVGLKKAAAA